MNVTYLIGNGFDINLGFKTQYKDFIKRYLEIEDKDDSAEIKRFKNDIKQDINLWSSAELALGKYTEKFDGEKAAEEFCNCHDDFCIELAKYLVNETLSFDEKELAPIFAEDIQKYADAFREVDRDKIIAASQNYGQGITYNFITFNYTYTLDKLVDYSRKNLGVGQRIIQNTRYENRIGDLIHVHGTVEKDMIMGVDNETQIANVAMFEGVGPEYRSDIIKIENNRMNGENTDSKAHELLKSSHIIYIYGMSLGETDAIWWKRICEVMKKDKNVQLIIYSHDAPSGTLIRRKRVTYDNGFRRKFTAYCDLEDEIRENIENRISIQNNNIFINLSDVQSKNRYIPLDREG